MSAADYTRQLRERHGGDAWRRAARIRLLTLDVDGVLTDGKLYFANSGDELKAFSTLDGLGLKLARSHGIEVALITGRQSKIVAHRAANLGLSHVYQHRDDKLAVLDELAKSLGIDYAAIAHIGDDLPDLPLIRRVGLGMTVANAHPVVATEAQWRSQLAGGNGAVREACDYLLAARGVLEQALAEFY